MRVRVPSGPSWFALKLSEFGLSRLWEETVGRRPRSAWFDSMDRRCLHQEEKWDVTPVELAQRSTALREPLRRPQHATGAIAVVRVDARGSYP